MPLTAAVQMLEFPTTILAGIQEYAGTTNAHPVGIAALVVACVLVCALRRQSVPVVLLALAALVPSAQRIVIIGADFNFVRFLVLIALARQLFKGELWWIRVNAIDVCLLFGALARVVCYPIVQGSMADLALAVGSNFELVGSYIVLRCAIRSLEEMRGLLYAAAWICLVVVPFVLIEQATGRNMFSVFGGIQELTDVRGGKLRCRAGFPHAILAGCFFAAWIPLWMPIILFSKGRAKMIGIVGVISSVVVVVCCASSTPAVALLVGLAVWLGYPVRQHLRIVYLSTIALGVVVHFVMTKPIWHLISRIDLVGGSTGYHRYRLIDAAINRFSEWWFLGVKGTGHWGYGLFDITNQFVLEGVRGGVWAFLAICGVFLFSYATIGRELRRLASIRLQAVRNSASSAIFRISADESLVFGLGAALCTQMAIFLAVSYFGQATVVWQFLMALGACMRQWSSTPVRAVTKGSMNALSPSATGESRGVRRQLSSRIRGER